MPIIYTSKPSIKPKKVVTKPKSPIPPSPILAAFVEKPNNIHFETQSEDEKIILLLRRHLITNVPWILVVTAMFFLPVFVPFLGLPLALIPFRFQMVGFFIWYLLVGALAFQNFLVWYFNVYILTDKRVIDIDFYALLYKEISDASLDKIQDVTYKMGGAAQTLFNYGDVLIQTAAETVQFEFEAVPKPGEVVRKISEIAKL